MTRPKDRRTIDEVLSAYLRSNAQRRPSVLVSEGPKRNQNRVDYQAIVRVLGSRGRRDPDGTDKPVNLGGVDLAGVAFFGGNYENAVFEGAHLADCILQKVELQGANLFDADVQGADLREANLTSADLRGIKLDNSRLEGAILRNAHLERASFLGTRLSGADFLGAELEDAHFEGVDLLETRGLCAEQVAHINRNNQTRLPSLPPCQTK